MISLALFVFGVIFGSFINALVWRLHEQEEGRKSSPSARNHTQTKHEKDLSILHGRSMCTHCGHTLAARDLIPVLSWVSLRGKCRYCKHPISVQYPLVELLTGVLFWVAYISWPLSFDAYGIAMLGYMLLYIIFFVALAVYDLHWFILPNRLVYPLVGIAASQVVVMSVWLQDWRIAVQAALAVAVIFGLFWVLFEISDGKWIGGGDVKLAIALGLIVSTPLRALFVIFLASLVGTIVSLPSLGKGSSGLKAQVPFGPPLLLATLIIAVFGPMITSWYQGLLY